MAGNNTDISLRISAEDQASASLGKIADEMESLGKSAGGSSPELKALTDRLRDLGAQQQAIDTFAALKRSTADTAQQLDQTTQRLDGLSAALGESASRAEQAAAAHQASAAALATAKQRHADLKDEVRQAAAAVADLRQKVKEGGDGAGQYGKDLVVAKQRLADLRTETKQAGDTVRTLGADQRAAAAAAQAAAAEHARLNTQYKQTVQQAAGLSGVLGRQNTALDASRQALSAAGISTQNLSDKKAELARASAAAASEANQLIRVFGQTRAAANTAGDALQDAGQQAKGLTGAIKAAGGSLLALAGINLGADTLVQLGKVSDAAKQLEGRLKLATTSAAEFDAAFSSVRRAANTAGASINATAELFGKLTTSTRELGVSQERVAGLTDTINKSIAISGASAASAEAGITQLAQALGTGQLRGDEFNSVMEQMPRLAQALADGLGVPIGKLREMAEAGELTTERVVAALERQSAVINAEFGQMPQTIGQAIQRISNEWQVLIGEMDKTTGVSATVVSALGSIASNMDGIAKAATTVGEVAVAALAVKGAAAIGTFAAGLTGASLASGGLAAATGTLAFAMNGLAAAGRMAFAALPVAVFAAAAVAAAELSGGMDELRASSEALADAQASAADTAEQVRARLAEISAQTGVTVTSMQALDAATAAGRIVFDEATSSYLNAATAQAKAALASTDLSTAAQGLVLAFTDVTAKGKDVDAAIQAMLANFKPDSYTSVQALGQALVELQDTGKLSAEQVAQAWQKALAALSGEDLAQFEVIAKRVFQGTETDAKALAGALDATLRKALTGLGLDAEEVMTGFSKNFTSASGNVDVLVNNIDTLKSKGVDTAELLSDAFSELIRTSSSQKEIDALTEKLVKLGKEGTLAPEKVADAIGQMIKAADDPTKIDALAAAIQRMGEDGTLSVEQVNKAIADLNDKLNSIETIPVEQAFKALGIQSAAALKQAADAAKKHFDTIKNSGVASTQDVANAFSAYAEKAIEANGGVADAALKAEARVYGLAIAADKTGKDVVMSMEEAAEATKKIGDEADESADKLDRMADSARDAADAVDDAANARDAADAVDDAANAGGGGGGGGGKSNGTSDWKGEKGYSKLETFEKLKGLGLTDEEASALAFTVAPQKMFDLRNVGDGKVLQPWEALEAGLQRAYQKAMDDRKARERKQKAAEEAAKQEEALRNMPARGASPSTTHTVNISFGGVTTPINTASAADSEALTALLRQLATAQRSVYR